MGTNIATCTHIVQYNVSIVPILLNIFESLD